MNCKHFLEIQHLWQRFSKDISSNWFFKLNNTVSSIFMIFKGCMGFIEAKAHISILKIKRNGWIRSYFLFFFSVYCVSFLLKIDSSLTTYLQTTVSSHSTPPSSLIPSLSHKPTPPLILNKYSVLSWIHSKHFPKYCIYKMY